MHSFAGFLYVYSGKQRVRPINFLVRNLGNNKGTENSQSFIHHFNFTTIKIYNVLEK